MICQTVKQDIHVHMNTFRSGLEHSRDIHAHVNTFRSGLEHSRDINAHVNTFRSGLEHSRYIIYWFMFQAYFANIVSSWRSLI